MIPLHFETRKTPFPEKSINLVQGSQNFSACSKVISLKMIIVDLSWNVSDRKS